jgi:hypothetical protein
MPLQAEAIGVSQTPTATRSRTSVSVQTHVARVSTYSLIVWSAGVALCACSTTGAVGKLSPDGSTTDAGREHIIDAPPGDPGCGLSAAAFCDTFDAPSNLRGRAGELDPARYSASRGNPKTATPPSGVTVAAAPARVTDCHEGIPEQVFPSNDAFVCDPTESIHSRHALVAVGSQNYGQNSYRIRQPFDFTGRTGKISFDASAYSSDPLLVGWMAISITEDPTPVPGFSLGPGNNFEGSAVPRNAIEVHFNQRCGEGQASLGIVDVIHDFHDTVVHQTDASPGPPCLRARDAHLNHFEVELSKTHLSVYGSDDSEDGVTFPERQLLWEGDVSMPFERGYVQLSTHNHASRKYTDGRVLSVNTRWDNVGFDGPIVRAAREYEIPDSQVPGQDAWDVSGPVMSVGYRVRAEGDAAVTSVRFQGVDPTGMTRARIGVSFWFNNPPREGVVLYRLNGGAWHERPFSDDEYWVLTNGFGQGALSEILDVPVQELRAGDNELSLATRAIDQGYPPAASAIDLILD